jgi:predicted RNase H-like HicB family nuclease
MRFTASVVREPPWFVARCLEVEVASQGRSPEEALANLREALELYVDLGSGLGRPDAPTIVTVEASA